MPVSEASSSHATGGAHWTASTLGSRLDIGNKPWSDYESSRKGLTAAMKTLGFSPAV